MQCSRQRKTKMQSVTWQCPPPPISGVLFSKFAWLLQFKGCGKFLYNAANLTLGAVTQVDTIVARFKAVGIARSPRLDFKKNVLLASVTLMCLKTQCALLIKSQDKEICNTKYHNCFLLKFTGGHVFIKQWQMECTCFLFINIKIIHPNMWGNTYKNIRIIRHSSIGFESNY